MQRKVQFQLAILVAASMLGACTNRYTTHVRGDQIHRNMSELRQRGVASVSGQKTDEANKPKPVTVTLALDQEVQLSGSTYSVAGLIANCPESLPFVDDKVSASQCPLVQKRNALFQVQSGTERDYVSTAVAAGVLTFVAAIPAAWICLEVCPDEKKYTIPSTAVLAVVGGWAAYHLVRCVVGKGPCAR